MRILTIGNFGRSWDGSICDEEHIAKALESLGHTVERWQREDTPFGSTPTGKFDFILIAQWNGYPENLVPTLKKITGAPVVYWAFDYQWDKNGEPEPEDWHIRLATQADLFLSKEEAHAHEYIAQGANFQWLAQDFAPDFLDRQMLADQDIDVLFTGSFLPWAPERNAMVRDIGEKFNLVVHSVTPSEWSKFGIKNSLGPVIDEDLPGLYARARINLSIDWKYSAGYWSDRNAQIMCCEGFVLFRHVPMSESVFRDKVAYFYDLEDCAKKIRYYLKNDAERMKMAVDGYKFAQQNLKVVNRVQDLLTLVGAL